MTNLIQRLNRCYAVAKSYEREVRPLREHESAQLSHAYQMIETGHENAENLIAVIEAAWLPMGSVTY